MFNKKIFITDNVKLKFLFNIYYFITLLIVSSVLVSLTFSKNLYHKIFQLHDHGRDTDGEVKRWGRNSRLDNLQAAILSHKLKTYEKVIKRRREVAQMYQDRLSDLSELQLPPGPSNTSNHFDVHGQLLHF